MIREIPKSYEYTCDRVGCNSVHVQENANGHYADSRPPGWANVIFREGSKKDCTLLVCSNCVQPIRDLICMAKDMKND